MLYFAYGANTNINNMNGRCPNAKLVGNIILPDYELVFKGVADIEQRNGTEVQGVLWDITDDCERSLDIYEGFPTLYRKESFAVKIIDRIEDVMFYKMNRSEYSLPNVHYFNTIQNGYIQNDLDTTPLFECLRGL